jgi:hypothetical protein
MAGLGRSIELRSGNTVIKSKCKQARVVQRRSVMGLNASDDKLIIDSPRTPLATTKPIRDILALVMSLTEWDLKCGRR